MAGRRLQDYFRTEDPSFAATAAHRRALEGEATTYDQEWLGRTFRSYVEPFRAPSGEITGCIGVSFDVTERRAAETTLREYADRLQALSRQLMHAQETERRHIARELHDEIGQALTAVKINLLTAKRYPERSDLVPRFDESIELIDTTLQRVRDLSLDLRPSILDDLGLAAALEWYVDRHARRTGLEAEFLSELSDARLPTYLETTCFRVAQEALTNVTRHAGARHVQVILRQVDGSLCLMILDDGRGFDVDAARARAAGGSSIGLLGMEERALLAGGTIIIESKRGSGTLILVRLPLASDEELAAPAEAIAVR
jgi:signal transduction histidine kinase